jgi:hypothetical protein
MKWIDWPTDREERGRKSVIPSFVTDLAVVGMIIGLAVFGWRMGLFMATLVGLQILVSVLAALTAAVLLVDSLRTMDMVQSLWVPVMIYGGTFVACLVGIRLAIGAFVPDMAVPLSPRVDVLGGAAIGAVSGWLLAGALLVGWSIGSAPGRWRFSPDVLAADPGAAVLGVFARCVERDPQTRSTMLYGEAAKAGLEGPPYCSEPFLDTNGNGLFDIGEPFLDVNRDGAFTPIQSYADDNENGRRDLGLLECHRLGTWGGVTVWHAPRITSAERVELDKPPAAGDEIYQVTAVDADGVPGLLFGVRVDAGDGATPAIEIGSETGAVVLVRPPADPLTKAVKFTVTVTDTTGLTDELPVKVVW